MSTWEVWGIVVGSLMAGASLGVLLGCMFGSKGKDDAEMRAYTIGRRDEAENIEGPEWLERELKRLSGEDWT